MDTKDSDSNASQAEVVALGVLRFLASDSKHFDRFISLSGLSPQDISALAAEPHFLASVMDYILSDERLLLEFAETDSLEPGEIVKLRYRLPGANQL